jgi:hypothetical protein
MSTTMIGIKFGLSRLPLFIARLRCLSEKHERLSQAKVALAFCRMVQSSQPEGNGILVNMMRRFFSKVLLLMICLLRN